MHIGQAAGKLPDGDTSARIAFSWLLHLRWGAIACQVLLLLVAQWLFAIHLPLVVVSTIIAFEVLSNLFFHLFKRRRAIPAWLIALVLFVDVSFLTGLLYYTGGPMNPFTFLYLVHIALAAMLMQPLWAWSLMLYTDLCYASVFVLPSADHTWQTPSHCSPAPLSPLLNADSHFVAHLQGMWLAFGVTAFFIVFFGGRIQKSLGRHQETLIRLKEERARSEKLAALATLAAGATHELSTPLATIAVASREMVHALREEGGDEELMEDALLIRKQVEDCKEILHQMAADAGEPLGETVEEYSLQKIMDETLGLLPPASRERVRIVDQAGPLQLQVPLSTLKRVLKGLLKNGLDASNSGETVTLRCRTEEAFLVFEVEDHGQGMDATTLARATEPFFTTKDAGQGMGLGLFLAKSAAERFGGDLELRSVPGSGTMVRIRLAFARISKPDDERESKGAGHATVHSAGGRRGIFPEKARQGL